MSATNGKNNAITMKPTMPPNTTINNGAGTIDWNADAVFGFRQIGTENGAGKASPDVMHKMKMLLAISFF